VDNLDAFLLPLSSSSFAVTAHPAPALLAHEAVSAPPSNSPLSYSALCFNPFTYSVGEALRTKWANPLPRIPHFPPPARAYLILSILPNLPPDAIFCSRVDFASVALWAPRAILVPAKSRTKLPALPHAFATSPPIVKGKRTANTKRIVLTVRNAKDASVPSEGFVLKINIKENIK